MTKKKTMKIYRNFQFKVEELRIAKWVKQTLSQKVEKKNAKKAIK